MPVRVCFCLAWPCVPAKVDSLAVHVQETSEGFSTTILLAETVADIPGGSDQASTVPVFFLNSSEESASCEEGPCGVES